jgi:RNA-directed DNA polymerase
VVKRRTSRKKLQAAIRDIGQWIKTNRDCKIRDLLSDLQEKVRGHGSYYGLRGNSESLATYFYETSKRLFQWLNRRSQRRSYKWAGFNRLLAKFAIKCPTVRKPGDCQLELGLNCVVL